MSLRLSLKHLPKVYANKHTSCSHFSTYTCHGWRLAVRAVMEKTSKFVSRVTKWDKLGLQTQWRHFYNTSVTHARDMQHGPSNTHGQMDRNLWIDRGETHADIHPQFYLWSLSLQGNCITNNPITQREQRRCYERERRRDGHKERGCSSVPVGDKERRKNLTYFLSNEKNDAKILSVINALWNLRMPHLLPLKRRGGWRGGPWGLKDAPPQLDLGDPLDSVELRADVKCHLSLWCSLLILLLLLAVGFLAGSSCFSGNSSKSGWIGDASS